MSSPDGNRSSGGERNSTNMRMAKWKQEAIQEGMRLVEVSVQSSPGCPELLDIAFLRTVSARTRISRVSALTMGNGWQQERQQSEEMHQLLRKRIEFLTEELEMTRSELNVKAQECDELMEVAEELDKELARDRPSDESDSEEVHDQTKAQTWLEKLQENLQLSASKHSKGARLSSLRWIDTFLQVRARVRVGLSLARSHPLFRARVCARVRSPSPCCPPASVL